MACTTLRHTTMFTYSHANTPVGQSERAYYLSYFIYIYLFIYLYLYIMRTQFRALPWVPTLVKYWETFQGQVGFTILRDCNVGPIFHNFVTKCAFHWKDSLLHISEVLSWMEDAQSGYDGFPITPSSPDISESVENKWYSSFIFTERAPRVARVCYKQ